MRILLVLALGCNLFSLSGGAPSQQTRRYVDSGRLQALYDDLRSNDGRRRDLATLAVLRDPDLLIQPETKERLVELLERLNQVVKEDCLLRGGPPDGWQEMIISPLLEIIPKLYAGGLSRRAFLALARSSYNPDSPFAKSLGELGRPFLPDMLELVKADSQKDPTAAEYYFVRENAVALLTHLLVASDKAKQALMVEERHAIVSAIASAASDPAGSVRREVSQSLARVGDASTIPLLEEMVRKETGPYFREHMLKDLQALRRRTAANR